MSACIAGSRKFSFHSKSSRVFPCLPRPRSAPLTCCFYETYSLDRMRRDGQPEGHETDDDPLLAGHAGIAGGAAWHLGGGAVDGRRSGVFPLAGGALVLCRE